MPAPDAIALHRKLLKDQVRMEAYRAAIFETIQPGNTVVDAGCGTGILAMFACQAGARRVYAIEREPIIAVARELAEVNGFSDRITFLNQEIMDVRLDERVDVAVSELISKAVLGQGMAELVGWCRDHFLKPDGRIVPERVDLWVAPVDEPRMTEDSRLPEIASYGIDFSPLRRRVINRPVSLRVPAAALLAPGQIAYSYVAQRSGTVDAFDTELSFKTERDGTLHGWVAWFSSTLSPGVCLDNHPPGIASWDNLAFTLSAPVALQSGAAIELRFRGRADSRMPEMWAWDTRVGQQGKWVFTDRQSTFEAELLTPERLKQSRRSSV